MAFTAEDVQLVASLGDGRNAPPAAPAPTPSPNGNGVPGPAIAPPATPAAANGTPAAGAQPGNPPAPAEDEYDYVDLDKLGFESMEDLQERLTGYSELERQVHELSEYKNGPKFASDRQKHLYDFASKFEGMELASAKQLLDVVSLDLASLSDQQVRFESFKLDPANKGLSQEEIRDLFLDEEIGRFGNSEDLENPQTPAQKARVKQATSLAKEKITKMQSEWNATRTEARPTPAEMAARKLEHSQHVANAIAGFEGIQVKLQAQNDKGEKLEGALNYKLSTEDQKRSLFEAVRDPAGWWDRILEDKGIAREDQGTDYVKLADLITWIDHKDELLNKSYQQGREDHKADLLKTARNVGDPGGTAGTPPAPTQQMSERKEANQAAMKAAGYI